MLNALIIVRNSKSLKRQKDTMPLTLTQGRMSYDLEPHLVQIRVVGGLLEG